MFSPRLRLALVCLALAGCVRTISPAEVRAIEIRPENGERAIDLAGEEVAEFLRGVECHEGNVLWKGGRPATFVLADGRRVKIRGFSFYGHFYRVSRHQWCVLDEAQYARVFGE